MAPHHFQAINYTAAWHIKGSKNPAGQHTPGARQQHHGCRPAHQAAASQHQQSVPIYTQPRSCLTKSQAAAQLVQRSSAASCRPASHGRQQAGSSELHCSNERRQTGSKHVVGGHASRAIRISTQ
jgi:hypothetical protein